MTVCQQLLPEIEKAQSVTPQTIKYRYIDKGQSLLSNRSIESAKKSPYAATLLLSNLAKIDKSNVAA